MLLADGHSVRLERDVFGAGARDVVRLPPVGERGWVLLTKDKNIGSVL